MFSQTLLIAQFSPLPFPGDFVLPKLPPCQNAGFEQGNFTNWETFVGSVTPTTGGINLSTFTQTLDASQHNIVSTSAIDPLGGFSEGVCNQKAAKIGDLNGGRKSSMIKYTFTVNSGNVHFSFKYAMVLQDPGHPPEAQPFFQYMILTGNRYYFTNANQIIASKKFTADGNNPFFSYIPFSNTGIVYKNWSTECIDLSAYMGQTVSILFIVADCAYSGHGAYAYIDCLCKNNDAIANMTMGSEFCLGNQILMNGIPSINEDSYFVSIAEANQNGYVIPGTEKSKWFVAQQAGIVDITALANQLGFLFQCNRYYKIKLAVTNQCVPWDETSKIIYIRCPTGVGLGQDISLCCDNLFPITIEDENYSDHPYYTYDWTSSPTGLITNPTVPSFTITPNQSATYSLTVTDNYGCTLKDDIDVVIQQDFTINITTEPLGCCSYNLVPHVTFTNCKTANEDPKWILKKLQMLNFQWSDGFNGAEHQVSPSQNTTYSLTVGNLCYSHTVNIDVAGCPNFSGEFPRISIPGIMRSNTSSKNDWLVMDNANLPLNASNGYKATRYYLRVWDRWGNLIYDHSEENCEGFNNDGIYWNGRTNNGVSVQDGIYNFRLTLYNNTYPHILSGNNGDPYQYNGGKSNLDWHHPVCTNPPPWWCLWCICNSTYVDETTHTLSIEVRN